MSTARPASSREAREQRIFFWAAATAAVMMVGFVAWVAFRIGGDDLTIKFEDIGEGVPALLAAFCCGVAARRNTGRQRLGWALLSASSASWCAGEVAWSVYNIGLGIAVPYPSAADVGYLGAIPLAAAGILAFFSTPRGTSTRLRLWLDGAIVFLALLFVSWTLGLSTVYRDAANSLLERAIGLAYPVGDILVGTVLVLAIRRARDEAQGRLLLLLGGLAANSLADSAFVYLTASGAYGAIGSSLDVGWVVGYLMIGLAALWPSNAARKSVEHETIDLWQLALPWIAILGAGLSVIGLALTGHILDTFLTFLAGALVVLVMVSQVFAHYESLSLLIQSRLYAATLNDIILYAPLGVIRIGLDNRIIQANPRFGELLRMPEREVVGSLLSSHFHAEDAARAGDQFRSLADRSLSAIDSETEATRGDGTRMWLHWSATAVHKEDGKVDYFIAMFNDTTARHEAEVAAVANLSVLERLNRLKSGFLTMVSHEFRTALVGIQGFSELMRDEKELDLSTVKGFASDIYDGARKLAELLDRMLDLDQMETDRVEIHLVPIDLSTTVRDAVMRARASDGSHPITIDLEPGLPPVAGDAGRLSQLMAIVLSNAIKYSPEGTEIAVCGRKHPGQVVVSIKDHGVGMPPDFDDNLFARYQWSATNPTTKVMGTGLGLPMARQIIEMHGGRIWFESKSGVGSEFFFSVPVETAGGAAHEELAETIPVKSAG